MTWRNGIQHCERAIRTSAGEPNYDKKWGRYLALQRFNVDQSPLPFDRDTLKSYEHKGKRSEENRNKNVGTSQPKTGESKCFCTLIVCFRPIEEPPKLEIISRGKGKRLSAIEKPSWDKDVDVHFQKGAWASTEFCLDWPKKTFKAIVKDTGNFILFLDNLKAHVEQSVMNSIKDLGRIRWFGVPNATDIWQLVDGGYAAALKTLINQELFSWLDDEDNVEGWYGAESHITASGKRILITMCAGNAYRQLNRPSYDKFRWRLFKKTGCLIIAYDSQDDKINPEGLLNCRLSVLTYNA